MYSAPSETKLDEDDLRSPTFQRTLNDVKLSPMSSNRTYIDAANAPSSYNMKPLNGDSRGAPTGRENFESDYSAFIGSTSADVRRSSLTDVTIYPSPILGPTTTTPEFCTIRRNPSRGGPPDPLGNATSASIHPAFPSPHPNGSVGTLSGVPLRPMNGSIQPSINRHSAYLPPTNPSTCTQPPPPPPYPRSSSNLPQDGVVSPKPSMRQKFGVDPSLSEVPATTEAKYIFSPEAMLKPGTLV